MLIAALTETAAGENRVSVTPESARKYCSMGFDLLVQNGAGLAASFSDRDYENAGAMLSADPSGISQQADILLKVRGPDVNELRLMRNDCIVVGMLSPAGNPLIPGYVDYGLTCFSLELLPRISRAQSMDVLSSQANIGGYRAVLLAAQYYARFFPMLMTSAGTVTPARVLILGAGVAGLQAIATARRLGAMVEVFDVRPAVKEQVESLGGRFVEVEAGEDALETAAGYAREMTAEYKQKQADLVREHAIKADIIITTALIPGRPAPKLIEKEVVEEMKPGSVIVDMAVETGGNCALSELDRVVIRHGVTLVGISNIPALMATDASQLYARNLLHFMELMSEDGGNLHIDPEDEIVKAALLCRGGELFRPEFGSRGDK